MERQHPTEDLGVVRSQNGDLLLLDFGLLRMWSGDEAPVLDDRVGGPELAARANAAVDLEIVGPDAAEVAQRLDLAAVKGRYAFDSPSDSTLIQDRVSAVCAAEGLQASVRRIDRTPHHERVRRLLDEDPYGVEVPFHGVWGVAIRGVPSGRPLRVRGRRMDPEGDDAGRWESVWVECDPGPPVTTVPAGYVLVDEARLMFADPTALSSWVSDRSLDGRADLVLWGRDAEAVAEDVGARLLPATGDQVTFGWMDLPVDEAESKARQLAGVRTNSDATFAVDFRPHDDHHRLLTLAWASDTGAASVTSGGLDVTGFFTSWGDGAFPVFRDLAADGSICRFRVELGAPEIVQRTRRLEELWFGALSKVAIVSARVCRDGRPVGWLYREPVDRESDSGWRVLSGDETDEYLDDPDNAELLPLRELLGSDPDLEELFAEPAPAAFERQPDGRFTAIEPPPRSG